MKAIEKQVEILKKMIDTFSAGDSGVGHELYKNTLTQILAAQWNDVKDGLPTPHKNPLLNHRVLVYCKKYGDESEFGWYNNILKEWFIYGSPARWPVTHWSETTKPEEV